MLEQWRGPAAPIVAIFFALLILLAGLWRWAGWHEKFVKKYWKKLGSGIRAIGARWHPPLVAFLRARLSPSGYLGLRLTVGVLLILGGASLFGAIVEDVVTDDPSTVTDQQIEIWLHAHATPWLTTAMKCVTFFGSRMVIAPITAALILLFLLKRDKYRLAASVLAVPGAGVLSLLLKLVFQRHRPILSHPLLTLTDYSLPSGHATVSMVFYGFLAVLLAAKLSRWRWRVLTVMVAGLVILLIDFSRLYLGVHFLSDVVTANAAGLAWLSLVLTSLHTWRHRRRSRHPHSGIGLSASR